MAPRPSATASASRSSRTRSQRRSARPSSTSSSAPASRRRAASWTSGSSTTSCRSPGRSSPTARTGWARAATTSRSSSTSIPRSRVRSRPRSTRRSASTATWSPRSIATRCLRASTPRRARSRPSGRQQRRPRPSVTTAERALDPEARLQHALDLSYRYLGYRDRTVLEVRRHLESKRVEPDTIEQAVAELQEQGYLNDARFARRFAEDRRTLDHWGNERIERKLQAAGVDGELIAAALHTGADGAAAPPSQ